MNSDKDEYDTSEYQFERKVFLKNTFYSYLNNFATYFLSIVTSFFVARLISPKLWGFILLATSILMIISIISSFLPPGLEIASVYYISKYKVANERKNMKLVVKYSILVKIVFLIPIYVLSLCIFFFFAQFFQLTLEDHINLLFILSPLIIFTQLGPVLNGILQGFNMFKTIFWLSILMYIFHTLILSLIYFFNVDVQVEIIAITNLIALAIPFLLKCFIIFIKYIKIKPSNEIRLEFKDFLKQSFKYGIYVEIGTLTQNLWLETKIQALGLFQGQEIVLMYHISNNFSTVPRIIILSKNPTLRVTFSRLDKTNNDEQITKFFNLSFNYSLFLYLMINGLFYFLSDFFLFAVYIDEYLIYSYILKFMIIANIFNVLGGQFEALIHATNKVKYIPILRLVFMVMNIPFFFVGLIFFGIKGMFIFLLFAYLIHFIIMSLLCFRLYKLKINVKVVSILYLSFIFSIIVSMLLESFLLRNFRMNLFESLNLKFFESLPIFTMLIFIILSITLILLFKVFKYEELKFLEDLFDKKNIFHYIIRRSLKLFERILRLRK
ncbi:MAG: lipopolysaccharide biosynthesis protein [Candidatus Hodarchaeota archaeon]